MEKGDFDVSYGYFKRAYEMIEKMNGSDHPDLLFPSNNLGVIAGQRQKLTEAIEWFGNSRRLIGINRAPDSRKHELLTFEAQAFLTNNDLESAEQKWNTLLTAFDASEDDMLLAYTEVFLNLLKHIPSDKDFQKLPALLTELEASGLRRHPLFLKGVAEFARHDFKEATPWIELVLEMHQSASFLPSVELATRMALSTQLYPNNKVIQYRTAFKILDEVRNMMIMEEARSGLYSQVDEIYETALNDILNLSSQRYLTPLEEKFLCEIIENGKSFTDRWYYSRRAQADSSALSNQSRMYFLRSRLLEEVNPAKEEVDSLILLSSHYNPSPVQPFQGVAQIQSKLSKGDAYISFITFGDQVFGMRVSSDSLVLHSLEVAYLDSLVQSAYFAVNSPEKALGSQAQRDEWKPLYAALRPALWDAFVEETDERLFLSIDPSLAGIRFGLFDYLAGRKTLRNPILVPFADQIKTVQLTESPRLQYWYSDYHTSSLPNLAYTKEEYESLASFFDVSAYSDSSLHFEYFSEELMESDWVHLSVHAVDQSNNERAFIFPNDELVSVSSLYQIEMRPRHVFLSACGTGTGKALPGEGITSLAMPFLRKGASSVIASGWNVDDRSTSLFTSAYYAALGEGQSSSEAFSIAQLAVINDTELPSSHPYFWSAWQQYGADLVVETPRDYSAWIIGIAILLLLALFVYQKKKNVA